jgi:hypothetical protein
MGRSASSAAPNLVFLGGLLLAFAFSAHAAERRFVPVPQSDSQVLQVVEGMTIVSAAGTTIDAGASMAPASARQAWLSVSVKNKGAAPVAFGNDAIRVANGGKALAVRPADAALEAAGATPVTDECANASASSQVNCGIDQFTDRQADRIDVTNRSEAVLAPGQLLAQQFQVDLPRKSRDGLARLDVSVRVGDEELVFVFEEVK